MAHPGPGFCAGERLKPDVTPVSHAPGILVHGDNHFIVRGSLPDRVTALALTQHWSLIQIEGKTPEELAGWSISSREFRENLEWAVVVKGNSTISAAVTELLAELSVRGIAIHDADRDVW